MIRCPHEPSDRVCLLCLELWERCELALAVAEVQHPEVFDTPLFDQEEKSSPRSGDLSCQGLHDLGP